MTTFFPQGVTREWQSRMGIGYRWTSDPELPATGPYYSFSISIDGLVTVDFGRYPVGMPPEVLRFIADEADRVKRGE